MSNFYLDVLKDRLYTMPAKSSARRSAQTAMYEILQTLVKLVAPVLTFTAEETWGYLPGGRGESIQLADWPEVNTSWLDPELDLRWQKLLSLRDIVTRRLEEARRQKIIGSSLGAALQLFALEEAYAALLPFKERLPELFIVSACSLHGPGEAAAAGVISQEGFSVVVSAAEGEKCERCWNIRLEVGHDAEHPTLCRRCLESIA